MQALIEKITYRLYEDKDLERVLHLWEKYSGWGAITEQQFRKWYLDTPYGYSIIIVATDEADDVVGQLVFSPSRVMVGNRNVKALRAAAPILVRNLKNSKLTHEDHPIYAMFRKGVRTAQQQGFSIIYLFPAFAWIRVLKLLPKFGLPDMQPISYDCFTISLQDASTFYVQEDNFYIELLKGDFNAEYDELWDEASIQFPINLGVVRNSIWLNWKLRGHIVFEIRERTKKRLEGYIAIKKDSGLIVDALAKDSASLVKNMRTLVRSIHHLNPYRISTSLTQLNGMHSALFQKLLPNVNTINFSFAFGCCQLNENIGYEQINPSNWYLMPND